MGALKNRDVGGIWCHRLDTLTKGHELLLIWCRPEEKKKKLECAQKNIVSLGKKKNKIGILK